jgi:hypothetical protein
LARRLGRQRGRRLAPAALAIATPADIIGSPGSSCREQSYSVY